VPHKPARICACGVRIASGTLCACQLRRAAEGKARHDRNRPNANDRGYSSAWQKARVGFLASHPLCECGAAATVVDHKRPHRGDKALFWDRHNWQPMCVACHSGRKQSQERRS
jgi:5-methylcytosine-specific restriction endonuclease McrA